MRTLKLIATLIVSAAILVVTTPLLWALGRDRRERMASELYPYDDDDVGVDVDDACADCGWPTESILPCLCPDDGGES